MIYFPFLSESFDEALFLLDHPTPTARMLTSSFMKVSPHRLSASKSKLNLDSAAAGKEAPDQITREIFCAW